MTARIRTSWQAAWVTLAALLVASIITLGLPTAAHAGAACVPSTTQTCAPQKAPAIQLAPLGYSGWTYLNLNYCAPGMACTLMYRADTPAWKWTGKAWATGSINGGWVYVAPFGGNFRWAYTTQSGWVALSTGRFEIRPF
ncbi:MAG: hypothetical protein H7287_11765 [Thermoleophilia bacterium]|nr:hypothetical protein [Thermoleophilia bacterium]